MNFKVLHQVQENEGGRGVGPLNHGVLIGLKVLLVSQAHFVLGQVSTLFRHLLLKSHPLLVVLSAGEAGHIVDRDERQVRHLLQLLQ